MSFQSFSMGSPWTRHRTTSWGFLCQLGFEKAQRFLPGQLKTVLVPIQRPNPFQVHRAKPYPSLSICHFGKQGSILLTIESVTAYSYDMTKHEKLLARAKDNPKGLSFNEFQTLLRQSGWTPEGEPPDLVFPGSPAIAHPGSQEWKGKGLSGGTILDLL
jgi:hypothetical protein